MLTIVGVHSFAQDGACRKGDIQVAEPDAASLEWRRSRSVTMKEIARRAGVSQSTVSRVLNDVESSIPIAANTRERVVAVAHELGYRPNPLARGLRGAPTGLIGLIVREIADPFFASMVEAIITDSRRNGYNLMIGHAESRADEALALKSVLETRHCDAIIMIGDLRDAETLFSQIKTANLPLVGLCQGSRLPGLPSVNVDNRAGAMLALDYLYELGHRRIAFINGGWGGDVQARREAYFDFMRQRTLPVPPSFYITEESDAEGGVRAMQSVLALPERPSAVFVSTDIMALGALKAASTASIQVPRDLSVIGFDDIALGRFSIPALTTVRQPVTEMARLAVEQVISMLGRKPPGFSGEVKLVEPELVVRESCASPPARSPRRTAKSSQRVERDRSGSRDI